MKTYYIDTDARLLDIFREHCNLSSWQYEFIRKEFFFLKCDIQEEEPAAEIEKRCDKLHVIFDFLYETKELDLKEYTEICDLVEEMRAAAEGAA